MPVITHADRALLRVILPGFRGMIVKTSIYICSGGTYAILKTDTRDMSVLISSGTPTVQGLQQHALELRTRAARLLRDAEFVELGATKFMVSNHA